MANQDPVTWDYRLVRVEYETMSEPYTLVEVRVVQYNRESGSIYAIGDEPVILHDSSTALIREKIHKSFAAFDKDILDHQEELVREGYGMLELEADAEDA